MATYIRLLGEKVVEVIRDEKTFSELHPEFAKEFVKVGGSKADNIDIGWQFRGGDYNQFIPPKLPE